MNNLKNTHHLHCLLLFQATGTPLFVVGFVIMESEDWKDIIGYEGYYMVSNLGNVLSLKRTIVGSNQWTDCQINYVALL